MTGSGAGLSWPRRWGSVVNSWLSERELERTGRTSPAWAGVTVGFIYLLGFGLPIYAAVRYLVSAHVRRLAHTSTGWRLTEVIGMSLIGLAILLAVVVLAREAPSWARPTSRSSSWVAQLKAFGLTWAALLVSGFVANLIGIRSYPQSHSSAEAWPSAINSLLAGPAEEIVVLVVPMVFLRAAKRPWWQVIAIGLVLRIAYHVYYGYPAAGLLIWALAMILVYLRTHAVIGLILAHSSWDLAISIRIFWSQDAGVAMFAVPFLSVICWGIGSCILLIARRAQRNNPAYRSNLAAPAPISPVGWYSDRSGYWWWWDGQHWHAPPPPQVYS